MIEIWEMERQREEEEEAAAAAAATRRIEERGSTHYKCLPTAMETTFHVPYGPHYHRLNQFHRSFYD